MVIPAREAGAYFRTLGGKKAFFTTFTFADHKIDFKWGTDIWSHPVCVPLKFDSVRSPSPLVKPTDKQFLYPSMTSQDTYASPHLFLLLPCQRPIYAFIGALKHCHDASLPH